MWSKVILCWNEVQHEEKHEAVYDTKKDLVEKQH